MRSPNSSREQVAEVTRRRLELLSAELAGLRPPPRDPPSLRGEGRPGEHVPGEPPAGEPDGGEPDPPGRHARRVAGAGGRASGWLHDRLPPTLQGRVQLGASHLTVVALLVAAALAASAWFVLRADRGGTVVRAVRATPTARPTATMSGLLLTPSAAASPSPSATARLVVDVAGKVRHPGIVTLPGGARVVDALRAAGGARRRVDLSALNLARPLTDGEQVLVGLPAPTGVAAQAASAPGAGSTEPLVNLNTATEPQLESLPGIGPVTAAAILKWRSENGPFTAVDQLQDVSGIGDAKLAQLAPFVTL